MPSHKRKWQVKNEDEVDIDIPNGDIVKGK